MADATLNYDVNVHGEAGVTASFRKVAASIDDTDKAAHKATSGMDALSRGLSKAQTDAALLRREFAETGNIAILKEITKADKDVKRFSAWIADMAGNTADLGTAAAASTMKLAPFAIALGAVGAVGVGAAAAAAVGGVALAGLGAGVLGAAFKVQSGSAEMTAALDDLSETAKHTLFDASKSVGKEFVPAIDRLEGKVRSLQPELRALFEGPSEAIGPLAQGVMGYVDGALPGLQSGSRASADALKAISEELPTLGETVGGFFDDIASESDAGIDALMSFISVVEIAINTTGKVIKGAEKVWEWTGKVPGVQPLRDWITGMADADGGASKLATSGQSAARAIEDEAAAAKVASTATRSLSEALGLLNFDSINAAQAQIQSTQATQRFSEAMRDSKNALNGNSAAALVNRANALSALEGYGRTADGVTKLTGDVGKGTASFYANVAALRATTPAGSSARAQLEALIGTFTAQRGAALRSANSVAAINTEIALLRDKKVKAEARGDASEVRRLNAEINALRNRVVYITTVVRRTSGISETVNYGANPMGGQQRAAGGSVAKGRTYEVGETGREWFVPAANGSVVTDRQMAALGAGGGGGVTIQNLTINMPPGSDGAAVVRTLQRYAKANGPIRGI